MESEGLGEGAGVVVLHNHACESACFVQNFSTSFDFTRSGSTTLFKYLNYGTESVHLKPISLGQLTVEIVQDALGEVVA